MLPSLNTPIYELTLPVSKQNVKFRPFLVKEQKILLMSQESDENNFTENNVKEIIKSCCQSDINIDNLSQIDIEYLFLQLRARSVSEVVETKYRCNNKISENETCGNLMDVSINLLEVGVDFKNNADTINLTDTVGIKLKYPDLKVIKNINPDSNILEITLEVIYNCIDYIFDENNFYYPKETPKQELINFLESMNIEQFKRVEEYFNNLPTLSETLNVKCNKCGFEHSIKIEGLNSFLE
jgi:T4 bacteriophage base plate protein